MKIDFSVVASLNTTLNHNCRGFANGPLVRYLSQVKNLLSNNIMRSGSYTWQPGSPLGLGYPQSRTTSSLDIKWDFSENDNL